jgi:membrane-associated phospholipid phosphatase
MLTIYIHSKFKEFTTNMEPKSIFKRPRGATDCSIFNDGGLVDQHSGFPSGHVSSISFLMMYEMFKRTAHQLTVHTYLMYMIPVLLIGMSRYAKGCHTIGQIVAGYLLGTYMAYLLFYNFK